MYDVAIVGAGPAGSSAANILADKGFKVIILEKEVLPRYKCCAGGISLCCLSSLYKLDIDINEVALQEYKGFALKYREVVAEANLGRTIGWGVYRDEFDNLLAKSAIYNGSRITQEKVLGFKEENGYIKVKTENGTRDTKLLFGADGLRSIIRKQLNIEYDKNKIGFCLDSEVKATTDVIEEFHDLLFLDFSYLERGFAWIFPKKQGNTINIGLGGYLNSIQSKNVNLKDLLYNFVRSQHTIDDIGSIKGALLPFGGTVNCFGKGNIILLGDAAGLSSPLDGEGISYALESGIIGAECAIKHFEEQIPLAELYNEAIEPLKKEINDYALTLQNKLYGSDFHRKHFVQKCASNDKLMETISKIFTHIISYEEGVKMLSPLNILVSSFHVG